MIRLTLIMLFLCSLIGCYDDIDDKPTVLTGKVLDYYSSNPVPNYQFVLYETRSALFGTRFGIIDSFKTDTLGFFKYTFTATNKCKYQIASVDTLYQNIDRTGFDYEKSNFFTFNVKQYKVLAISIHFSNLKKNNCLWGTWTQTIEATKDTTIYLRQGIIPETLYRLSLGFSDNVSTTENKAIDIFIENKDTTYKKINE